MSLWELIEGVTSDKIIITIKGVVRNYRNGAAELMEEAKFIASADKEVTSVNYNMLQDKQLQMFVTCKKASEKDYRQRRHKSNGKENGYEQ